MIGSVYRNIGTPLKYTLETREKDGTLIILEIHRLYVGRNWLETKSVKDPLKTDLVVLFKFNRSS